MLAGTRCWQRHVAKAAEQNLRDALRTGLKRVLGGDAAWHHPPRTEHYSPAVRQCIVFGSATWRYPRLISTSSTSLHVGNGRPLLRL